MTDRTSNTGPAALRGALRRFAEAATPGPWTHGWSDGSGRWTAFTEGATIAADPEFESPGVVVGGRDSWGVPVGVIREPDADYIAAADPSTILGLLDELAALAAPDPAPVREALATALCSTFDLGHHEHTEAFLQADHCPMGLEDADALMPFLCAALAARPGPSGDTDAAVPLLSEASVAFLLEHRGYPGCTMASLTIRERLEVIEAALRAVAPSDGAGGPVTVTDIEDLHTGPES